MTDQLSVFEDPNHWDAQAANPAEQLRRQLLCGLGPRDCASLLDLGCGAGFVTAALSAEQRTGLDMSQTALRLAAKRGIRVARSDLARGGLPFRDRSFDMVCAFEVLEHLPEDCRRQVAREMQRVARRWLLVSVPYREDLRASWGRCAACGAEFHVFGHVAVLDERALSALFPGFRVVEVTTAGQARCYFGLENFVRLRMSQDYAAPRVPCPRCESRTGVPGRRNLLAAIAHASACAREIVLPYPRWLLARFERAGESGGSQ